MITEKDRLDLIAKVVTRVTTDRFGVDGPSTWKAAAASIEIPPATFARVRLSGRAAYGTYIEVERKLGMPKGILSAIRRGDLEDIAELAPRLPITVRDLVLARMGLATPGVPARKPRTATS